MVRLRAAGRCACGTIHFELQRDPLFVHCCHCSWCQRETGSAFALNALIESDQVQVTKGQPEQVHTPSNSGHGQDIFRCPACRVALWSHYCGAAAPLAFVRVGALEDPSRYPPDIHIFTSTKQAWLKLDDRVPVKAEYYRRSEYWPSASLERYRNLAAPE